MPYNDDPVNVPADAVRFLVGDTNVGHEDLTDGQVDFLLASQNGNILRAAARGAETLAAKFAKTPSEKRVGPLMIMEGTRAISKSDQYMRLAKLLWARATRSDSIPYAGGISRSDKTERQRDTDRTRPAFARRMMRYPNGDTQSVMPEEILSPSEEL